jgi:uncharacterized alpha-E superfamily protein
VLSRTAENLYWTGRYMERAENIARILDVSLRSALQGKSEHEGGDLTSVLDMLGERERFTKDHTAPTIEAVTTFSILDPENASSIFCCLRAARENLRALRAAISNELWESVNTAWLAIRELDEPMLRSRGAREQCEWVVARAHLFRGIAFGTTLHDDAFHFMLLGSYVERADNTARLLAAKYDQLKKDDGGPASAYYGWGAVLHSLSAFRAYHQVFRDVIDADRVADLLVLRRDMPRSLRFCAQQTLEHLDYVAKTRDLESQRLAGELYARLRFGRMDRILSAGLTGFLREVIERLGALGDQISKDFLMTA